MKATELGLGSLTPTLDPAHFDPMRESHWTLAMVVAWIAWADFEHVRDCLPRWREQHQSWYWREYMEGDESGGWRKRGGWLLEQTHKGEAPLMFLSLCEAVAASEGVSPDSAQRLSIHDARLDLWDKLAAGDLTAVTMRDGAPRQIAAHEWPFLHHLTHRDADVLRAGRDLFVPAVTYDANGILMRRDDVLRLWPSQPQRRRGRKPGVGLKAKEQIEAMRAEDLPVDKLSQKELAKALKQRGVIISSRQAAKIREKTRRQSATRNGTN
ncbi:MAG: hypothetical protein ABL871_13080 [Terricaulis sp.]